MHWFGWRRRDRRIRRSGRRWWIPFHRSGHRFWPTICRRRHAKRVWGLHERKSRGRGGPSGRDLRLGRWRRLGCGLDLGRSFDGRRGRCRRTARRWPGSRRVRLAALRRRCRSFWSGRSAQPARHQVQARRDSKGCATDQQPHGHRRPPPDQARPAPRLACGCFDARELWV